MVERSGLEDQRERSALGRQLRLLAAQLARGDRATPFLRRARVSRLARSMGKYIPAKPPVPRAVPRESNSAGPEAAPSLSSSGSLQEQALRTPDSGPDPRKRPGPAGLGRTFPLATSAPPAMQSDALRSPLSVPADRPERALGATDAGPEQSLPPELHEQAANGPGGWVYEIDPSSIGAGSIPPERIAVAWRIDDDGSPTDELVANPYYRPVTQPTSRWGRRLSLAALLIVNAIVFGGLAVFLTLDRNGHKSARVHSIPSPAASTVTNRISSAATHAARHFSRTQGPAAIPGSIHLEIVPTARVWACIVDQRGRVLTDGILDPRLVDRSFVATAFRIFTGNGSFSLRINGKLHRVPPSSDPVAYSVTRRGAVVLPAGSAGPCA